MAQDGWSPAKDAAQGSIQGWVGLHLCGRCLQPGADAEPAVPSSSASIGPGEVCLKSLNSAFGHTSRAVTMLNTSKRHLTDREWLGRFAFSAACQINVLF